MTIACLFPGQGSQAKGMGAELFDRYRDWTSAADDILGYSIRELCVDDPRGELRLTQFTQPALYVVNALMFRARMDDGGVVPGYLAGHSLGEYNALLAAGAFEFTTGLRLVRRRGEVMGQVVGGGMAAVIGLTPARIEETLADSDAGRRLDVANFNSFDQTVLAGLTEDITAVKPAFEAAGARAFIPLKVSAPFHSRYMRDPMLEFATVVGAVPFAPLEIPVIANATGEPYPPSVRETLATQIGHAVRWLDSMCFLLDHGVSEFEEVGPGTVLTKLIAQIKKNRAA